MPQQQCRDCVASIHTSEGADLLGNLKLYGDREPAVVSAWFRDLPILVFIARYLYLCQCTKIPCRVFIYKDSLQSIHLIVS